MKVEYGIGPMIPSFKVPGIRVPGSKLKIQNPSPPAPLDLHKNTDTAWGRPQVERKNL